MSISFVEEVTPEAKELIKQMDGFKVMDNRTALFDAHLLPRKQLIGIADAAKQPLTYKVHAIGDRKEVGGVVYELDELGWRKVPFGL